MTLRCLAARVILSMFSFTTLMLLFGVAVLADITLFLRCIFHLGWWSSFAIPAGMVLLFVACHRAHNWATETADECAARKEEQP